MVLLWRKYYENLPLGKIYSPNKYYKKIINYQLI